MVEVDAQVLHSLRKKEMYVSTMVLKLPDSGANVF